MRLTLTLRRVTALVCLWWFCLAPLPAAGAREWGRADPNVLEACESLAALLEERNGIQDLVNPVLESIAEVGLRAEGYREMLSCLDSTPLSPDSLDWARNVRYHLRLFLSFAAPLDLNTRGSTLELIELGTSQDPAIRRLLNDVGLPPPEGLILVRYFERVGQMPEIIRRAFESPETRAVTISARYIAVLTSIRGALVSGRMGESGLAATLSHELVHAFLNARLDVGIWPEGFPRWFHEGMAIYFSESGRVHVGVDPVSGGLLLTEPTARYEQYERVFRFLESELGLEGFRRQLRRAVEDVDPSVLYRAVGLRSYDDLALKAELWWRWWPLPPAWFQGFNAWILAVVAVVLIGVAVAAWRRWQPAVPGSALEGGLDRDLIAAVRSGELEDMRYLLRSGSNPEARDDAGWSALAWAVSLDDARAAELLIDHGATVGPEIEDLAATRSCSPETTRVLTDGVTRADADSVDVGFGR